MTTPQSRRQLLRYVTGTAALVLGEGCASRPAAPADRPRAPPAARPGATMAQPAPPAAPSPDASDLVVQPTPSSYFTSREPGSREMNWGPARDYGDTVPNDRFYIHSRTRPPTVDIDTWRLEVGGDAVGRPLSLTFAQLLAMPQLTVRRTLDCGANCRAFFPRLPSRGTGWLPIGWTQWHFGAVGAAEWTGVCLKDVLDAAGLAKPVDVMFTGLDAIPTGDKVARYAQVIPIDKVLAADTLLVHRMNGEPLPVDHGYPVRVIFSGWGGNTSVKWVGRIEVSRRKIPHPSFQARQVIAGPEITRPYAPTVGPVRSALEIDADVPLAPGDHILRGRAWSGSDAIAGVDVSIERLAAPGWWVPAWDPPWRPAELLGKPEPMFWVRFEVPWPGVAPGRYRVMTRARDAAGNVQPRPDDVVWNQAGFGFNGHAPLGIVVLDPLAMP